MPAPRPVDWANPFTVPYGATRPALLATATHRLAYDLLPTGEKVLQPVRPNVGLRATFRRRLEKMVKEMDGSVRWWVRAAYRANTPAVAKLAQDAALYEVFRSRMEADTEVLLAMDGPADDLAAVIAELKRRWFRRFAKGAEQLAEYFATAAGARSDARLRQILKEAGFSVSFTLTQAQRDIAAATVHEAVSLIKSIPEQYFKGVEGLVMRSVQTGRDLSTLTRALANNYGVTRRRATFIARDQNNKATAAFTKARQQELGIAEAQWQHSGAGKQPRPSHVKAGREKTRYKIAEGWFDPDLNKRIWPGTEPNCRCTGRPILPGFV